MCLAGDCTTHCRLDGELHILQIGEPQVRSDLDESMNYMMNSLVAQRTLYGAYGVLNAGSGPSRHGSWNRR
jgi:hypothetical protein